MRNPRHTIVDLGAMGDVVRNSKIAVYLVDNTMTSTLLISTLFV